MLEPALTSGFIAAGADVVLLGPVPTPTVAFMTRSLRADFGVMISASHNLYYDNGIKFFNSNGFKLSLKDEINISDIFHNSQDLVDPEHMGKAKRLDDAPGRYIEFVKNSFPKNLSLFDVKIVIDTANGAAYKIAPQVFWELGAEIIKIGAEPDGLNINKACGATDTALLQKTVTAQNADIGIALDGDADRLIIVTEEGEVLDGDYVIATIATDWLETKKLTSKNIVATKMSNIGLERYLNKIGLDLSRCEVGDKHVLDKMLGISAQIGGEKSGHIIPIDYSSTGDGLIAALQILAYIQRKKIKTSDIKTLYTPFPQEFMNIPQIIEISDQKTIDLIERVKDQILNNTGRIIIRKSGTENLTRIMIESENKNDIIRAIEEIKKTFIL
jgi:phosphoglucosamine mutase